MRELTKKEIEVVNGAGMFRDLTGWIGKKSGSFIGRTIGGLFPISLITTVAPGITGYIGERVGGIIGDTFGSIVENIFSSKSADT